MQIKEEDDYWYIDIYPNRDSAYQKMVNNNIVDIGYDEESKEYFVKGVHYYKSNYTIEKVMDKAKKIYLQAKEVEKDLNALSERKECAICKGLNRIKQITSINHPSSYSSISNTMTESNTKDGEYRNDMQSRDNVGSFSPSLLKLIIDLPSRLFLTPMGRKLSNAFLLLVSNLLRDQARGSEKQSIETFMDHLIKDITIDEKELPYLYNNLSQIAEGIQKNDLSLISSALIKNPETTRKYLDSLLPDNAEKEKKKKKLKQRKFI